MAYKVFTNGSSLPASDLNTYLVNQSVPVFATTAERDSSITSPTEGMLCYVTATSDLMINDGSSWRILVREWQDFTPSFSGGFSVGAGGSVVARYSVKNGYLIGYVEATMGTGSTYGSGLSFDAPLASSIQGDDTEAGKGTFKDGALRYLAGAIYYQDTIITRSYSNQLYLTSTAPFTPAAGDVFSVQFKYEV